MNHLVQSAGVYIIRLLLLSCSVLAGLNVNAQSGRPDDVTPVKPNKTTGGRTPGHRGPKPPHTFPRPKEPPKPTTGSLNLNVIPFDCIVEIDNQQAAVDPANGMLILNGIYSGTHSLLVRREGYRENQRTLDVLPGEPTKLSITLEALKGTLSVRPDVSGTAIELRSIARDQPVGTYAGGIEHLELPPGEYEVTISKSGYVSSARSVTINGGSLVEIEPHLDFLPSPKPARPAPRPMNGRVELDGKYLIVYLSGSSQDDSVSIGSINVTASKAGLGEISGSLNGAPCRIEFFKMENIDEWSVVEPPSPSNQYSRAVIRVRPKDAKRLLRFAINWKSVNGGDSLTNPSAAEQFAEAVPIYKVVPEVPVAARSSRTFGTVKVTVAIDETGNVVSAKATDGPIVLRQAAENAARRWKFRPATQNGRPTSTMQVIQFNFAK
jgi:TonB family protein